MAPKAQRNDLNNKLSRFSAEAYMKKRLSELTELIAIKVTTDLKEIEKKG
jgi:cell fate (sporulation/competence/biofilm development) regulator YlbF (YheA/YmcA/DUF963 family)